MGGSALVLSLHLAVLLAGESAPAQIHLMSS
jgi:hypothetical protein